MITLIFLATLAAIFVAIVLGESEGEGGAARQRPAGLLAWLTRGNWPAKIGGLLVLVGVGALLRYALLNIDVPDFAKLSAGVVLSVALGLLSVVVPVGPARRPLSLALGGAAFGVAYLTVYSAFALFGYLENPMGLGLLGLTSIAAAVYAVQRSALSLAVLSMAGAFLAPAFAIGDPGPVVVYGYYVGAGTLTLVMVIMRGWRPLIHLSFLFTLVGGIFFAWTASYFAAPHADVMLVFLLALTALHVAMPLLEKPAARLAWLESLDLGYLMALPIVAVVLAFFLAQDRLQFSTEVFLLAAIWAVTAAALLITRRDGAAAHAVIAGLLAALAVAVRFRELPWELLLLAFGVLALVIAAWWRRPVDRLHGTLAGSVVLFGALHMLDAVGTASSGPPFANGAFAERIIGAVLLVGAGAVCRRIRQPLDTLLLAMGILWAVLATGIELVRIELATVALVTHWTLVLLAASLWIPGRRLLLADRNAGLLAIAVVLTALWAAAGQPDAAIAWASGAGASLALIGLAIRPQFVEQDSTGQRTMAALGAPVTAAIWAFAGAAGAGLDGPHPGLAAAVLVAVITLLAGRPMPDLRGAWLERIIEVFGIAFALGIAVEALLDIARSPWAVALELLCLTGLLTVTWIRTERRQTTELATVACALGLALILQANLLRGLGPPGDLVVTDVLNVSWPAVISLLWVSVGFLLTVWSRRVRSRSLWIAGATLLVVSAVKLLVYDFVSLGELANILAVIAAGGVFLLVGWLAPMPPAMEPARAPLAARPPVTQATTAEREEPAELSRATRTIATLLAIAALVYAFRDETDFLLREILFDSGSRQRTTGTTLPPPVTRVPPAPTEAAEAENPESATAGPGMHGDETEAPSEELETRVYDLPVTAPQARPDYVPPSTRGADGVPAYTQYSYPQATKTDEWAADVAPPPKPAAREAGIDQLRREGRIRPATREDVDRWVRATGADPSALHLDSMDRQSGGRFVFRTYVVLREMTFPEGLHGAHSVTFIVPRGVPRPYGDPGHSRVLEMP